MNMLIIVPLEVTEKNAEIVLRTTIQRMFPNGLNGGVVHVCINETADQVLELVDQKNHPKKPSRHPQRKNPAHDYAKR